MGPLAFLALLTGAVLVSFIDNEDDTSQDDDPDLNEEDPDLGVTVDFDQTTGLVDIDVGEDETRDLVAVRLSEQSEPDGAFSFAQSDSLQVFLVENADDFPPTPEAVVDAARDTLVEGEDYTRDADGTVIITSDVYFSNIPNAERFADIDLGTYSEADTRDAAFTDARNANAAIETNVALRQFTYVDAIAGDGIVETAPERLGNNDYLLEAINDSGSTNVRFTDETEQRTTLRFFEDVTVTATDQNEDFRITHSFGASPVLTVNLNAGGGDDSIQAFDVTNIDAGDGDDTVRHVGGSQDTILGGAGDDYLNTSGNARLDGGAGADTLYAEGQEPHNTTTLTGGDGADTFIVELDNESFSTLSSDASNVTVSDFVLGEDVLLIDANVITDIDIAEDAEGTVVTVSFPGPFSEGDGYTGMITLPGVSGLTLDDIALRDGGDIAVFDLGTAGDDNLVANPQTVLLAGDGDDTVTHTEGFVTVDTGLGDDVVVSTGGVLLANTGAGNDDILFTSPGETDVAEGFQRSSIFAGDGADTITVSEGADRVHVSGGAGADVLVVERGAGDVISVNGGAGDDSITLGLGVFLSNLSGADHITINAYPEDLDDGPVQVNSSADQSTVVLNLPPDIALPLELSLRGLGSNEETRVILQTADGQALLDGVFDHPIYHEANPLGIYSTGAVSSLSPLTINYDVAF